MSSRDDLAGSRKPRAELERLRLGALRELRSADPRGEAEVVLDAGARCGLAAGTDRIEQDGVSPSEAPYTAAASPAGPAPTTVRSTAPPASSRYDRPSVSASSPGVACFRTRSGISAAGKSALVSDAA